MNIGKSRNLIGLFTANIMKIMQVLCILPKKGGLTIIWVTISGGDPLVCVWKMDVQLLSSMIENGYAKRHNYQINNLIEGDPEVDNNSSACIEYGSYSRFI